MNRRAALALALLPAAMAAPAAAAPDADGPTESYFPLQSLTAGGARVNGRALVMTVECGIDAPAADVRTRAEQSTPRLRSALAVVVQRHASVLRPGQPPDVERLLRELQAAVNEVMGGRGARLLIGTVIVS